MSATLIAGHRRWSASSEKRRGHRTYKIIHRVRAGILDGPAVVGMCAGLPLIGSVWQFDNDLDLWAYCTPAMKITPIVVNEPNRDWDVENTFSTEPPSGGGQGGCLDDRYEDPLLEPDGVSGSFVNGTFQASIDKNGDAIRYSSLEPITGPDAEFDYGHPTVRIQQNRASLGLSTFAQMKDTVNDAALWGLPVRCVKLSNITWERKVLGTCNFYYTRTLDFEIDYDTFDRTVPDVGSRVLSGHWDKATGNWTLDNIGGAPPDKTKWTHFIQAIDKKGNPIVKVFLDGDGEPWDMIGDQPTQTIEYYKESNFLVLGIPTSF